MEYILEPFKGDEDHNYLFEIEQDDLNINEKLRLEEVEMVHIVKEYIEETIDPIIKSIFKKLYQ